MRRFLQILLISLVFLTGATTTTNEQKRIALVIGNEKYSNEVGPLTNPHNDIKLIGDALSKLGFLVTYLRDGNIGQIYRAINHHIGAVKTAGPNTVSFIYYSGHGAAKPNTETNYLIPIDVHADDDLWLDSIPLKEIVNKLRQETSDASHFVVFDACRNEFKAVGGKGMGGEKGFMPETYPGNMLIAFATETGKTASDRGEDGGIYARTLRDELFHKGVEAFQVFRFVGRKVREQTGQQPWIATNDPPVVYFAGEASPEQALVSPPPPTPFEICKQVAAESDRAVLELLLAAYESQKDAIGLGCIRVRLDKLSTHETVLPPSQATDQPKSKLSKLEKAPLIGSPSHERIVVSFKDAFEPVSAVSYSPDGTLLLSGGQDRVVSLWDAASGSKLRSFTGHEDYVNAVTFSPDGQFALSGGADKKLKLWEVATGREVHNFEGHTGAIFSAVFSPDGKQALSGGADKTLKLWDAKGAHEIRTFAGHTGEVTSVAFSPDGRHVLSASSDKTIKLWDATGGPLIKSFVGHTAGVSSVVFSPDGKQVLSGSFDKTIKLWDVASGREIRTFTGHTNGVTSAAFSPDGLRILSGGQGAALLWDVITGRLVQKWPGNAPVTAITFSPGGAKALLSYADSTIALWESHTGRQLVRMIASPTGEWVAITPAGFFSASSDGDKMASVVRGSEVWAASQFRDHLYRPELLAESLRGDPVGEYADAASELNLEKILDSGSTPKVELLDRTIQQTENAVALAVRITDTGGGIGSKVIWRLNGITQGELSFPDAQREPAAGQSVVLSQRFKIDPGKSNIIEVTAYNRRGLLASVPYTIAIDEFGAPQPERPNLFILAIGVDHYRQSQWDLKYSVADAKSFAQALDVVARPLFGAVKTTILANEAVTKGELEAVFARVGAETKPGDVFVLFLSGQGRSIAGRWYFIPSDLDFSKNGQNIERDSVGPDLWQSWLAKISAEKSLLIIDSAESAEAVGLVRSSNTLHAMDQLKFGTGRNLIAASGSAAFEGYKGHGVLTYALLEALQKQAVDEKTSPIGVFDLANYSGERVPLLSQLLFGVYQQPFLNLSGNDFLIGIRARDTAGPVASKSPTHVVLRAEQVRNKPDQKADINSQLWPGTQVQLLESVGYWALVARDGDKLGYLPAESLARLQ